jgi:glutamate transport system substrate-binding protein
VAATKRWRLTEAWRVLRLAVVITTAVLLAFLSLYLWWNAEPTVPELRAQAGLVGKRELLVGVNDDIPNLSYRDRDKEQFSGFDIEISYMIAADLGFRPDQVRFLVVDNEDRESMRARDDRGRYWTLDLVVASFSITKDREAKPQVSFSDPYLRTELSVVTKKGYEGTIQSLEDLRGKKVCTLTTSTANTPLADAGVMESDRAMISTCVAGVLGNEFEAVSSDAAVLAGFVAKNSDQLMFHDIGYDEQELWGVNAGDNEALRKLVNLSLCQSRYDPNDRRWEMAFETYLRLGVKGQDIAVDEQPKVSPIKVRAWPGTLPDACH